ncbi:zinc finger protein 35 isoform X2 [Micropterus dolomieu]|uniref:zinc finger protein 35 isoform X2 n=1 Tax=Micropterus dolomieu TaxID=147949 RepID=UPI001E8E56B0|nr:zinc finger protein 35 isoform X2 [Micropterus dolomieu]
MSSRLAFQTQLASIMEVLANAAVAEICKLVDDDYAVVSLQMSQCQRENKALKRKLHLLELKMARGNAERRLRESSNSSRPRVQINTGDRLREASPAADAVFERRMDVALWSGRGAAACEPVHTDCIQSKSPDVELVEPEAVLVKEENVEANMSRGEETERDVPLIGDDGVECVPCGAAGQRPSLEQQDTPSQPQIQSSRTRRTGSSRGVEKEEEPDVVLVKVEEVEPVMDTQSQTGLSIQEGLVESSTDDYRAVLPFDETTQTSTNQLSDQQVSGRGFSEVSYGCSSLWTNGGGSYCHNDSLSGPSSHCAPLSYLPTTLIGAGPGSSGRGLAVESSKGFHTSVSFQQQPPVIDLSEESSPIQVLDQIQGPQQFLEPAQSQSQGSYSSADNQQKIPRKRVCICRFCSKGFSSPANLESHLRTHTGERPYGCSICGKKFSQFWNLKIHRNIHTGERPYQCSLCPERFSDPSNLKKHQKRHHPQTLQHLSRSL